MRTTALAATLTATALLPHTAVAEAPAQAPAAATNTPAPAQAPAPATALYPAARPKAPGPAPDVRLGSCAAGELCLWQHPGFRGKRYAHELAGTDIESCVPLPPGTDAQALANRTGRPVTTYQSAECAETGEFDTYPGGGSWVPQSPYRVRAFKVWES
ncbi:peptidase inhibitor family I36 protein [Streptomyces sp. NPDC004111]|uniref:peptidase inhibitor family I36 protein n=1 Tax=Streptomyces sp. NPDC004111 TaxID=3364690 RepID=UPI00368C25DC